MTTRISHVIFLCVVLFDMASCQCNRNTKTVQVGYTTVSVTPPGYPSPGYRPNLSCKWLMKSSASDSKILFRVTDITLSCAGDALNAYDGTSNTGTRIHYNECNQFGTSRTLGYHVSQKGEVYTTFTSDNRETEGEYGFNMYAISAKDFSGTGCNAEQHLTADSSTKYLSSPNFPDQYDKSMNCVWHITTQENTAKVLIQIEFLEIESDSKTPCPYDFFKIQEAESTIAKLCKEDTDKVWIPARNFTSSGNSLTLIFKSDDRVQRRGFLLSYSQTDIKPTTHNDNFVTYKTGKVRTTEKVTSEQTTVQTTAEPEYQISTNCRKCNGDLLCIRICLELKLNLTF